MPAVAHPEHVAAHDPPDVGDGAERNPDARGDQADAERQRDRHREDHRREREHRIENPHDDAVGESAGQPCGDAQQRAQETADDGHARGREERHPRAAEHAGQHVAADGIGAHGVRRARRPQRRERVRRGRALAPPDRRGHRGQHEHGEDGDADAERRIPAAACRANAPGEADGQDGQCRLSRKVYLAYRQWFQT
jgi:hypothetical protein